MRANELRLGNFVLMSGQPFRVESIHFNEITSTKKDLSNIHKNFLSVKPIKLTIDILLDFGFGEEDMADLGIHFSLCISDEVFLTYNMGSIWIGEYDTKCRYVHQLQNLYFALTGQELECK